MKLRKWVQVVLLLITIGLFFYGGYAFARMEFKGNKFLYRI